MILNLQNFPFAKHTLFVLLRTDLVRRENY